MFNLVETYPRRFQELYADCNSLKPFSETLEVGGESIGSKCGIHGSNSFNFAMLRLLFSYNAPGTFLDLGSGIGESVIYAAHHGWQSYGIEFCRNAYLAAKQNIAAAEAAGYIPQGIARIALGNFFPSGFQVNDPCPEDEDLFRVDLEKHYRVQGDPYEELGITLADVDLCYHFQVQRRETMLQLFSEQGKRGGKLLFTQSMRNASPIPSNLEVIASIGAVTLYEKLY